MSVLQLSNDHEVGGAQGLRRAGADDVDGVLVGRDEGTQVSETEEKRGVTSPRFSPSQPAREGLRGIYPPRLAPVLNDATLAYGEPLRKRGRIETTPVL